MNLSEEIRSSILFDARLAEEFNVQAAGVDPRLFCFAYYAPYPWPEKENWELIFHLSILNLYSLLWDCGPHLVLDIYRRYARPNSDDFKKSANFCHLIKSLRTDLAHSNSEQLYFNRLKKRQINKFLDNLQASDPHDQESTSWSNRYRHIHRQAGRLMQSLARLMEFVNKDGPEKWLQSLIDYYRRDDHYLLHVLADIYDIKQREQQSRIIIPSEDKIKKWVNENYQPGYQKDRGYDTYRKRCENRVEELLKRKDCPKPAFPLPFFKLVTGDAQKFVIL